MVARRLTALGLALGLVAALGTACSPGPPEILILSPTHGTFTTAASVQVTGIVVNIDPAVIADVTVNGVSVTPDAMGMFSATVPLDPAAVMNPIVAEVVGNGGSVLRDRITVMVGDTTLDGDFSLDSIALHFTEGGLDTLEPSVESLVDIDLATLLPPGTLVIDNFCYQDSFLGCLGRVDATVSGSPPPSISGFSIDIDPMTNFVAGDITLNDIFVRADVVAVTGIGFTCHINTSAATTLIQGDYDLSPGIPDPEEVDVTQLGGVAVAFGAFSDSTDCDGFLGFIVEFFIGLFIGDIQGLMTTAFQDFLNAPDPQGNTPIAGAIEEALSGVEIAGPIGEAIGVNLEAPLFDVSETTQGITFGSDGRVTASMPDPSAVDLAESYHVDEPFPVFGPLSPGGFPYHVGMCISTSAFNQLLKAEIESGLLIQTINEFDFGGGPLPLTAGLLATVLPAFGVLDPAEPLEFQIYPTLAPIVTGEVGPSGELAVLRVPHLLITVIAPVDGTVLLEAAVDTTLGLDADVIAGELTFLLSAPTAQDIDFAVLQNPLLENQATLDGLLPGLVALAVPLLGDSLGSFPLPAFLGLQPALVETDRNGEFMSLFLDLAPLP